MNFKPAIAVAFLAIVGLQPPTALAQNRVFVSTLGSDSNVCSVSAPCRSFQHAHDVAVANGEIDVLDPGGYGAVNISKAISIQGHGFSGITAPVGNGISINAPETANVNLNGLLIEGSGTGDYGIGLTTAGSVTITNTSIREFNLGGLGLGPRNTSHTCTINVSDTILTHNVGTGATLQPFNTTQLALATFSRVQAMSNGGDGIFMNDQFRAPNDSSTFVSIFDSVVNGNGWTTSGYGIHASEGSGSLLVRVQRSAALLNFASGIAGDNGTTIEIGETQVDNWSGTGLISYGDNNTRAALTPTTVPKK